LAEEPASSDHSGVRLFLFFSAQSPKKRLGAIQSRKPAAGLRTANALASANSYSDRTVADSYKVSKSILPPGNPASWPETAFAEALRLNRLFSR
jgi:hypothetical protein